MLGDGCLVTGSRTPKSPNPRPDAVNWAPASESLNHRCLGGPAACRQSSPHRRHHSTTGTGTSALQGGSLGVELGIWFLFVGFQVFCEDL